MIVELGLRVKLRLGLKLCKLQGRFLARVNNVNYTVNYKISARARDSKNHVPISKYGDAEGTTALYTHSFNPKTPPEFFLFALLFAALSRTSDSITHGVRPFARISSMDLNINLNQPRRPDQQAGATARDETGTLRFKIVKNRPRISKLYYRPSRIPP